MVLTSGQDPSRSPTPITTAEEPEAQTTQGDLQARLQQKFNHVLENSGTQTLMEVDDAISADPTYTSQSEEQDPETRFLSPVVVGTGGGFHLDHPAHRPGNGWTYRGSKGGPRTIAANSPVPTESTQPEDPLNDPYIPLGYPDEQGSASPVPPDNNLVPSQLRYARSPTPSLTRELLSDGSSHRNRLLHHEDEDSATHISTSSKSMGDPIPTPPLASNRLSRPTEPPSTRPKGSTQNNTPTQSQAKRLLETPATPLPARKRQAMAFGPATGGKAYTTRLNITEINSQHVSSREISRRRTSSSQTQRKGKSIPCTRTQTPSGTETSTPNATGNNYLDLLEDFDEAQFVVNSAKQGVLVMVWALSMGEGNFQTRAVYAVWVSTCYSKVLELKLPSLDTTAMTMSDDMRTVILNYMSNMRYQDYNRVCEPIRNHFRLKNPSTPKERQEIKDIISELYPYYFHYRETNDPVDPYEGHVLFIALECMFYWGPNSIGAKYPALFRRSEDDPKDECKHLAVLAYLATMVQFCLEEWTEGYFKKGTLNVTTQHSVWLCHYDGLKNVSLIARKRLINMYNEWVNNA
ncbi:hypothetical protein V565_279080, partial [Rhizoctonia solani 123E]